MNGDAMKLVVTGAGGFLGRAVVDAAVAAGHDVTAMVRREPAPDAASAFDPEVRVLVGDLRTPGGWCDTIGAADVVIHAAAAAGGERGLQLANTVVGTENLLAALRHSSIKRFVHVSSFSVYDYAAAPLGSCLTEESPLEQRPVDRDAYTETKLVQEELVRRWCAEQDVPVVVLRPGAVVGPGRTWNFGAAFTAGGASFVISPRAEFKLISVTNCALAIVRAAEAPGAEGATVNLVDDHLPTHAQFAKKCRAAGAPVGRVVPVPWAVASAIGRALQLVNRVALGGRLKLPELLEHPRQQARWKPLHYSNNRARRLLGWHPQQSLDDTIGQLAGSEEPS
jgi:2-alkyl-3-oxoalkanoate reductase